MPGIPTLRIATADDAAAIALLHAQSWRNAYRGVLQEAYLDHAVQAEREALWQARLADGADAPLEVLLLESPAGLLGFACIRPDADPEWGPLIDNLHVQAALRGSGLGRMLMTAVQARIGSGQRHHLWVLAANEAARGFYARLGGREASTEIHPMPDGRDYPCLRVVWNPQP
ncbi:GNAT family N-acetyltransferase [Niveibacterium sp. 24ML]|uniref:GNAT family N-acetyltransferase n=1 Tax=Niveibacterium sp. 24ML TaxID=2985512 RepID=UPI00226E86C6|nr:GNAT family N-acetyltransferase [Niveibacterium sp. 24ML]MCX9155402.1 GNAT family N-acetyltransferase [Niveibacterium sp. 24ML]